MFFFYLIERPERPTHDVADVLLSLKHAVLKPSPDPQQMQNQSQNYASPQASLSYTVHPQMLVSPSHQSQNQCSTYSPTNYYESPCSQHAPPMYPSMSVNVSMNMTMHGYGADGSVPMQCSQWAPPNSSSSMNVLYPPLLSPGTYPGAATYSFTADFRPPGTSQSMGPMLEPMKLSPTPQQRPYYSPNMSYIPQKSPSYNQVSRSF